MERETPHLSSLFFLSVTKPSSLLLLKPPIFLYLLYYPSYLPGLPQVLLQCVPVHAVDVKTECSTSDTVLQVQNEKQTNKLNYFPLLAEILLVPSRICLIFFSFRACFWLVVLQVFSENHLPSHLFSVCTITRNWSIPAAGFHCLLNFRRLLPTHFPSLSCISALWHN